MANQSESIPQAYQQTFEWMFSDLHEMHQSIVQELPHVASARGQQPLLDHWKTRIRQVDPDEVSLQSPRTQPASE
jgi:hypothetical protein